MSQDFEKNMKEHGDHFKMEPREWVWHRVEEALDKKKRRRIVGWWWSAPLLLLIGAGSALYFSGNYQKYDGETTDAVTSSASVKAKEVQPVTPAIVDEKASSSTNAKTTPLLSSKTTGNPTTSPLSKRSNHLYNRIETVNNSGETVSKKSSLTGAQDIQTTTQNPETVTRSAPTTNNTLTLKSGSIKSPSQATATTETTSTLSTKAETTPDAIIADSANTLKASSTVPEVTVTTETAQVAEAASKSGVKPKTKKQQATWYLLGGVGMSGMGEISSPFKNKALSADYSSIPGAVTTPPKANKAGMSYTVTLQRRHRLSARWQWQAGLSWHYLQVTQYAGQKKDSLIYLSATNDLSATYFYQPGSLITRKGTNQRLFISNDISWQPIKKKAGFKIKAGLYAGLNTSNNFLVQDHQGRLLKNHELYKKWLAGILLGTEFVFKNKWTLGLNGRLDLSKSFVPLNDNSQHWRSWEARVGIPLNGN